MATISLSASTLNETDAPNTVVGSLSISAIGDIVTWSLTDNAGGVFKIWGGKQDQIALDWAHLDRAVATQYTVTVRATGLRAILDERSFTISINDVTDPGEISVTPVLGLHFQQGVTLSGSDISSVTAKWGAVTAGTSTGSSGAEPQYQNGLGPSGQNYALMLKSGAAAFFTHGSTGSTGTAHFFWVMSHDDNNNCYLLGSGGNTSNFIRLESSAPIYGFNRFRVFWGDGSNTSVTLSPEVNKNEIGVLEMEYNSGGGTNNLKIRLNGVLIGQATIASKTIAGSRIGKTGTTAATCSWRLFHAVYYNSVLSGTDLTNVRNYLTRWRAQRRYVSNSGDDTSPTPWRSSTPLATIARAWSTTAIRGIAIILAQGHTFTNIPGSPLSTTGAANLTWYFGTEDPYTTNRAIMRGGTDLSAAVWTDNGDSTWSTACATQPDKCSWVRDTDYSLQAALTYIDPGTPATTPNTFSWSAGTLTIRLDGTNPNGQNIQGSSGAGWTHSNDFLTIAGTSWRWFSGSSAVDQAAPTSCESWNVESVGGYSDGQNTGGTAIANYYNCESYHNGRPADGADGDGFSSHGAATTLYWHCTSKWNRAGGFRHLTGPKMIHDGCWAEGNNSAEYLQLNPGGANGYMKVWNSIGIVHNDLSSTDSVWQADVNQPATWSGEALNCMFLDINRHTSTGVEGNNNSGQITVKGCIIKGFTTGLHASAGGVITEDYNDVYDCSTPRTNVGTGAHSIAADPLFTDEAGQDFSLQSGSPARNTSTDLSLSYDYTGVQRSTLHNNMGAIETFIHSTMTISAAAAFVLTGNAAVLSSVRKILPAVGAFLLTGISAGLGKQRSVSADPGVFDLIGIDARLRVVVFGVGTVGASPGLFDGLIDEGSLVRLITEPPFKDSTDIAADPDNVVVHYRWEGDDEETVVTYGEEPQLVKKGDTGSYHIDVNTTGKPGRWYFRWEGTGAITSAADNTFVVGKSPLVN